MSAFTRKMQITGMLQYSSSSSSTLPLTTKPIIGFSMFEMHVKQQDTFKEITTQVTVTEHNYFGHDKCHLLTSMFGTNMILENILNAECEEELSLQAKAKEKEKQMTL